VETIFGANIQLPVGSLSDQAIASTAAIDPTKMAQRPLQRFSVQWTHFRIWDSLNTNPVGAAATDDLALITGTWASAATTINSGDCKAATTTRRIGFFISIPDNYQDGETVTLRIRAGMATTVASTSCFIDAEAYTRTGVAAGLTADLVTTAQQSMNALTAGDYDFQLNPTSLDPGMLLEFRLSVLCTDVATATAVIPTIYAVDLYVDTRG
jgi:hypothetical protein